MVGVDAGLLGTIGDEIGETVLEMTATDEAGDTDDGVAEAPTALLGGTLDGEIATTLVVGVTTSAEVVHTCWVDTGKRKLSRSKVKVV